MFAFFLESQLPRRCWSSASGGSARRGHFCAAVALFAGSWLSGYFIVATNAFMQHPVGHAVGADGALALADFWAFLLNPWALAQYAHNMMAAVVTGVVRDGRGRRVLRARRRRHADAGARLPAHRASSPASSRRCSSHFRPATCRPSSSPHTSPWRWPRWKGASRAARAPGSRSSASRTCASGGSTTRSAFRAMLSFLAYGTFRAERAGAGRLPREPVADNIELLYYAFHVMVGPRHAVHRADGSLAAAARGAAALLTSRRAAVDIDARLSVPVHRDDGGLDDRGARTATLARLRSVADRRRARAPPCTSGTVLFTLIGFCGLYLVLGILFLSGRPRDRPRPGAARCPWSARGRGRGPWLSSGSRSLALMLAMLRRAGRLRLRRGRPAPLRRARRTPSAGRCSPPSGRTGTATRSGCSPRGGVAVRRVPAGAGLRPLGVLLRDLPRAVVAHPARHRDRVPQPRRAARCGARRGTSCSLPPASLLPSSSARRSGTCCAGCRSTSRGWFTLALFTDFTARDPVGILDWYTSRRRLRARGARRPRRALPRLEDRWPSARAHAHGRATGSMPPLRCCCRSSASARTSCAPGFFGAVVGRPLAMLAALVAAAGMVSVFVGLRRRAHLLAFIGSGVFLRGAAGVDSRGCLSGDAARHRRRGAVAHGLQCERDETRAFAWQSAGGS